MVIKGADWFVEAAIWMARKTGIAEVLVGATIVSIGTTLPELAVSTYSSYAGYTDVALGNAVGSSIFNLGVILGVSILVRPIMIDAKPFGSRAILMLAAAVLVTILAIDGGLERTDGLLLIAVVAAYIAHLIRSQRFNADKVSEREDGYGSETSTESSHGHLFPLTTPGQILQFIAGALTVAVGSRFLVSTATSIAEALGIPEIVIGLTIVAAGTSLPELATAIASLIKGHQSLSAGNIVGASFLNMTSVLGFSSLVNRVTIAGSCLLLDFPVMLALMAALILFATIGRRLTRWQGVFFLAVYIAYTITRLAWE